MLQGMKAQIGEVGRFFVAVNAKYSAHDVGSDSLRGRPRKLQAHPRSVDSQPPPNAAWGDSLLEPPQAASEAHSNPGPARS